MPREISNRDDILDSRDIIRRIDELRDDRDSFEADAEPDDESADPWEGAYPDEAAELTALEAFAAELEGYGDWSHGEALIRDSYFEAYARQLAKDLGAVNPDAGWPCDHIDWKAAAEALQVDYTPAEFDGVTYWMRA